MKTFEDWFFSIPAGSTKMVCESFYEDISDCLDKTDLNEAAHSANVMKDWLKEAFNAGNKQ